MAGAHAAQAKVPEPTGDVCDAARAVRCGARCGEPGTPPTPGVRGFPHQYDLGEEWYEWTGLPCVFSRWLVRQDVESKDKALLEDALYVGLEEGVNAMYQLSDPRNDLLMLQREVTEYIRGLRYFMRIPEQRAIAQFRHYLQQLDGSVTQ